MFPHGSDRGAWGCVSVTPPIFMTEAEAREVIEEELANYGLRFEKDAFTVENVHIAGADPCDVFGVSRETYEQFLERNNDAIQHYQKYAAMENRTPEDNRLLSNYKDEVEEYRIRMPEDTDRTLSVTLDGVSLETGAAYEFVSMADHDIIRWYDDGLRFIVNHQHYAERLRNGLDRRPVATVCVFYQSATGQVERNDNLYYKAYVANLILNDLAKSIPEERRDSNKEYQAALKAFQEADGEYRAYLLAPAKDDLRAQAHDFGEWLVAQGIVPPPENPDAPDSEEELDP